MPTYQITGPDGKKYRITGDTPEGAMEALKKHMGGALQQESSPLDQMKAQAAKVSEATRNNSLTDDLKTVAGNADAMVRGAADTLSFGFADEIAAGGDTLVKGGGYEENLAAQRARDAQDAETKSAQRLSGQIVGGVTQGAALAKNGLSLTANAANKGANIWKLMGLGSVEGGGLGALQGLGSGEGTSDRMQKAAIGGGLGMAIGGLTPGLIAGGKELYDRASASFSPEAAKDKIMAALLRKSGLTADDLAARLQGAQDDGQDMFMAADAMELPGQRIMSTAARTPNEGRKTVVDALLSRQMDQGRRVAADLTDASGSNLTADQYRQMLTAQRSEDAARNYAPVMDDMNPLNVTPAVEQANRAISPVADMRANIRGDVPTDLAARAPIEDAEASIRDPIRQAVKEARSYLASDNLTVTNVEKAFRAKTNIDQMIAKATENGQGGQVQALMPVRDALDEALAASSPQYSSARDAYRTASQRVAAVDTGRELAKGRNRVNDTLSTFGALPDDEARQAARVGYFDPKIAAAETTKGKMPDVARQFTSDSMRQELPAIAVPDKADQLMRRLGRENTMSDTAQIAIGGSKTADNFSDMADSTLDPGVASNLLRGNFKEAILSALTKSVNAAKGMPPNVVERLIPALMETSPQAAQELFSASAKNMQLSDETRAKIISALMSTGATVPGRVSP